MSLEARVAEANAEVVGLQLAVIDASHISVTGPGLAFSVAVSDTGFGAIDNMRRGEKEIPFTVAKMGLLRVMMTLIVMPTMDDVRAHMFHVLSNVEEAAVGVLGHDAKTSEETNAATAVEDFVTRFAPIYVGSSPCTRLLLAVRYCWRQCKHHCFVCGRVIPGARCRVCYNYACHRALLDNPLYMDPYTAMVEGKAPLLPVLIAAALAATQETVPPELLGPVPREYYATVGTRECNVSRLRADLTELKSVDFDVLAAACNSNADVLDFLESGGLTPRACALICWLLGTIAYTYDFTTQDVSSLRIPAGHSYFGTIILHNGSTPHTMRFDALTRDLSATHTVVPVFHGSAIQRWLSIFRFGLRVLSGTPHMVNGAALGAGIYTATQFGMSYEYSLKGCVDAQYAMVARCDVLVPGQTGRTPLAVHVITDSAYLNLTHIVVLAKK